MKTFGLSLIVAGLVGTGALGGYGYAKQAQVDELTRELYATQDSLVRFWSKTREFVLTWANDTLSGLPYTEVTPQSARPPARSRGGPPLPLPADDKLTQATANDTTGHPPVCPGPTCPKMLVWTQFPLPARFLRAAAH